MSAGLVLGSFLATLVAITPAFADTPLKQWEAGIDLPDIRCADGLLLMKAATDRPACVTKATGYVMEGRGWEFVAHEPWSKATIIRDSIPVLEEIHYWSGYDAKFPPFAEPVISNSTERFVHTLTVPPPEIVWVAWGTDPPDWIDVSTKPTLTNIDQGFYPDDEEFWPQYAMEFPHISGVIGHWKLPYNYTYVVPNEYYGFKDYGNPLHQCPREQCEGQHLIITMSDFIVLLNKEAEFVLQATDSVNRPARHYNVYMIELPFDNTKPMQLDLEFYSSWNTDPYNRAKLPHIGMIYPRVHDTGNAMYFYLDETFGYSVFDPAIGTGELSRSWFSTYDERISVERAPYELSDTERGVQISLDVLQERADMPLEVIRRPTPDSTGPIDGVAPEYYGYLAAKLQENYPGGDYERILQESNVKQEWIDAFLDAMPSLELSLLEGLES